MIVSVLIFLLIFTVIVVSHEFGHFAVARRSGIRVNEFAIGMGPVLYKRRMGETDFCIRLLPLGGACVFDGLNGLEPDEEAVLDEHSFPRASVFARIATVAAGPVFNFILGFLLSLIVVTFSGTDLPVVQEIIEESAAEDAGLMAGDRIVSVNGERIHLYREVSLISQMNYGEPLTITYEREGEKDTLVLTPRYDEETGRYYIGIRGAGEFHACRGLEVFPYAFYETGYWLKATLKSLGSMIGGHFSRDDIAGPVGVVKVVDDTYQAVNPYGLSAILLTFLSLSTLLTVNLGVVNLLPIPALDGGRLVFLIIEAIRGKPVPPDKEGLVHLAGIALLMAIMVMVLFNDISRFFR